MTACKQKRDVLLLSTTRHLSPQSEVNQLSSCQVNNIWRDIIPCQSLLSPFSSSFFVVQEKEHELVFKKQYSTVVLHAILLQILHKVQDDGYGFLAMDELQMFRRKRFISETTVFHIE